MTADPRLPLGADPADLQRLDAIRARRAQVRAAIEGSPLARLEHGKDRARVVLEALQEVARLTELLTAVTEDRPDDARAVLTELSTELVDAIVYRTILLHDLAAAEAAERGR